MSSDIIELPELAKEFGLKNVYLTKKGSLILVLEKNNKQAYREIEDAWRYIENVDRVEPPLASELMLNILYEKIMEAKKEMEEELS